MVITNAGNETITGNEGVDTVQASEGNKFVVGGMGDADGNDLIITFGGSDIVFSNRRGDDHQIGWRDDAVFAGIGADTNCVAGADSISGNEADDVLTGGGAGRFVYGANAGSDQIT
jgi:Ca2+-binding RTX toxin-like protein